MAAAETLARVRGACRDLAVLFIAICRTLGLAARFVSGYRAGAQNQQERYMPPRRRCICPGRVGGVGTRALGWLCPARMLRLRWG